jgi:hypothetical protein
MKSWDLGAWVANARQLLHKQMSEEDFEAAMREIDKVANQAARNGKGLQATAKLLWKKIRK